MAVTTEVVLTGGWQLLHTATTATTSIVLTPDDGGVNWASRDDTTLPAAAFVGHVANSGIDREFFMANAETFFVKGKTGRKIYWTLTE